MKSFKSALERICIGSMGIAAAIACGTSIIASIGMGRDLSAFNYISAALLTVLIAVESVWIIHAGIEYINKELNEMRGLINLLIREPKATGEEKEND